MGTVSQLCKMEKVLEMDGDDGCITMSMNLMPLNCALKNKMECLCYVMFMLCFYNLRKKGKVSFFK